MGYFLDNNVTMPFYLFTVLNVVLLYLFILYNYIIIVYVNMDNHIRDNILYLSVGAATVRIC